MLTKEAQQALISQETVGSRIITVKFRTKMKNVNIEVVQCSAPTHDAEERKDFYNRLQSELDKQRKKDLKILMGDFNAKTGTSNSGFEHVMGKHGLE